MKKTISILVLTLGLFLPSISNSQIVYTDPALPTADTSVIVYFNAEGTPLEGYSGVLYTHTGLYVNGIAQWDYVIGSWGNNTTQPQLIKLEANLYKLEITPTIRDYYGASSTDEIDQMCFVFRSADGTTQTTPDIFIEVYEVGLNVSIITPDQSPYFVDPNGEITVEAESTAAQTISLYVDNVLISTVNGNVLSETINAATETGTKHWIKVVAEDATSMAMDSMYYYVRGEVTVEALPAGLENGVNYIDDNTVSLVLLAPFKTSVYVFGDFSDWQISPDLQMKRTSANPDDSDNRYWITITGLNPGEEYAFQYLIDEELVVAEPYSEKILDPWNDSWIDPVTYPNLKPYPVGKTFGIVSVIQTNEPGYEWQVEDFDPPAYEDLVIYELLVRDFVETHNYQTLIDTLDYLKRLGINAIELMPILEFEGNESWGYNPSFFFAPDKYYGTKNKLKEFIDVCHQNDIAIILDVVFNHAFGQCPLVQMYFDPNAGQYGQPSPENPWFNETAMHPFNVGFDFNHESPDTKYFVKRATKHWLEEYKVDGYRFDLSKGFTQHFTNDVGEWGQYDASRIAILEDYADAMWEVNPDTYITLEHFAVDSEEQVLANYGMMPWGNMNFDYNEATMGWVSSSNFYRISYKAHGFDDPNLVGYMESHDEERLMAKNINYGNASGPYNIQDTLTAIQRMELAGAFFFTVPGPKMMWQFGERAYDYFINYPGTIGGDDHRLDIKPSRWDYMDNPARKKVFDVYSGLINLKKEHDVFRTDDFTLSVSGAMKTIHLNHSSMNVAVIGNFGVTAGSVNPDFQHTGYWYDYFDGDSLNVENVNSNIDLEAGEYRIYTDVNLQTEVGINDAYQQETGMMKIYPNPSNGNFNISFKLWEKSKVKLEIMNMNGQKIKVLLDGDFQIGEHSILWDGKNESGQKLGKGIYFSFLSVDGRMEVQKIILN
ncbi:MAG: T9SS type A sorting domain-containing protein [Chlorobi bacterium]|nr:T9SS type A sorting domain-containing protein [Chlorobiota bacterium]